jgi:hypothetical protein
MSKKDRRSLNKPFDPTLADKQAQKLAAPGTPQDVTSERAKNQRHGKVTADKWNQ